MWGSPSVPSPRMRASSLSVARIVVELPSSPDIKCQVFPQPASRALDCPPGSRLLRGAGRALEVHSAGVGSQTICARGSESTNYWATTRPRHPRRRDCMFVGNADDSVSAPLTSHQTRQRSKPRICHQVISQKPWAVSRSETAYIPVVLLGCPGGPFLCP